MKTDGLEHLLVSSRAVTYRPPDEVQRENVIEQIAQLEKADRSAPKGQVFELLASHLAGTELTGDAAEAELNRVGVPRWICDWAKFQRPGGKSAWSTLRLALEEIPWNMDTEELEKNLKVNRILATTTRFNGSEEHRETVRKIAGMIESGEPYGDVQKFCLQVEGDANALPEGPRRMHRSAGHIARFTAAGSTQDRLVKMAAETGFIPVNEYRQVEWEIFKKTVEDLAGS